ncbi:hypothetical protein C1J01_21170 [Nonomuraea aridisoli]|uniref:Uncharacterized protein n=1 Tax=Nonomuraea aridisoli TaxID=2070368 RepID=A0A2W2EHP4_9ACTN|nr:hypothetical protein C1J01_21170 [Nonomuraea aridisoli]
MSKTELISLVLDGARPMARRLPPPGEVVAVARWRAAEGLGAVLFIRRRRDGSPASELSVAVRDSAGQWRDLELDSGASGYPDIFSEPVGPSDAVCLGMTETLISEADFQGGATTSVRLLELSVGSAITSVTCTTGFATTVQEISPPGICLAGVLGEESATVEVRSDGDVVHVIPVPESTVG